MSIREMDIDYARARVARLSVTGELGYEIYVPTLQLSSLFNTLIDAVDGLLWRHVGIYALNSLRLEKGYGIWSREFSRDYTPRMAGLDRFIAYERPSFVGRDAALRDRDREPARRLVTLAVDATDADASGYEPIYRGTDLVGFVTSGGYGHCAQTSLAMGYVDSSVAQSEERLSVSVLGEPRSCRILANPLIDPAGARMRA
jgi:dimethylglycine dehydrogenase